MATMVREREVSPVEAVQSHLRQIQIENARLNAFVAVMEEEAMAAARRAEAEVTRGSSLGLLHGVPVTVKDSFDVAGMPTLCGSRFRLEHRASADATAVSRLREAGAIILGKTNCPEFLSSYETDNYTSGRTNNPWDPERTPGGSSGGEAAAIASFCSAGGLGSDGGGSIRVPAHFCGIAGLKPTPGRISAAGHYPVIGHPCGLLSVAGPMARSAQDLRMLFAALAGYDSRDPFSAPVPLQSPAASELRIGLIEQFYDVPVQPAIRQAVGKAAQALGDIGFAVEPFEARGLKRAPNVWWFLFGRLPAPFLHRMVAGRESDAHWTSMENLRAALESPPPTAEEVMETLAVRDAMRASLLSQMEEVPVLLMPVCGITAFRHRERRWPADGKEIGLFQAMMPATLANVLGLPALSIPFDYSEEGLPVGIQLVGRPFEEELLLEIAVGLEEARGPLPGARRPSA